MIERITRLFAASVAIALLLTACSSSENDVADDSDNTDDTTGDDGSDGETITFELANGSALVADIPTEPVATAPATEDGTEIEIFQLERNAETVTLVFAIHNTTDDDVDLFNSSVAALGEFTRDSTVGGVTLLDADNLDLYLTFRPGATAGDSSTESDSCVCSKQETADFEPGERRHFAAVFPAPPADVETMTVQTGVGTVSAVPLSEAD